MTDIAQVPAVQKTLSDVKADLASATHAIIAAVDSIITGAEADVQPLTEDLKAAVISVLDAEVGVNSPVAGVINTVLGFAGPTITKLETELDAQVVYGLQYLKAKLDATKVA